MDSAFNALGYQMTLTFDFYLQDGLEGLPDYGISRPKRVPVMAIFTSDAVSIINVLTHRLQSKLWSAKFLVCFNFQSASMSLKIGENVV